VPHGTVLCVHHPPQGRLSQVGRLEERVDATLTSSSGLAGEVAELAAGLRQQQAALSDLRGEVAVRRCGGGNQGTAHQHTSAAAAAAAPSNGCTYCVCTWCCSPRAWLHPARAVPAACGEEA
jgi:hypothetical protein